jgi:hypothetical protein
MCRPHQNFVAHCEHSQMISYKERGQESKNVLKTEKCVQKCGVINTGKLHIPMRVDWVQYFEKSVFVWTF